MKIHVVGDIIAKGHGVGKEIVTGRVVTGRRPEEIREKLSDDSILVAVGTDQDMIGIMKRVKAVIVEEGGITSHAAIVGFELGIPVIVGVNRATEIFKDGMEVTVDPGRGHIYTGHARVL